MAALAEWLMVAAAMMIGMAVGAEGQQGGGAPPVGAESWCVARSDASDQALQTALDYACSAGADCGPIQPNGLCYLPNTIAAHSSYAFNSYYQRNSMGPGTCDFAGTATVAKTDPSYGSCVYPSSPSAAGGTTTPSTPGTNGSTTPTGTPVGGGGGNGGSSVDNGGLNPGIPTSTTDASIASSSRFSAVTIFMPAASFLLLILSVTHPSSTLLLISILGIN
ncbi:PLASMODESMATA CALLOSE-BINDING PROTEIN 3 [Malania oleifera]|uniref:PLASMODESMATA CALLOSE-BINDING PROTEIN 3 n=1 Tax=Malania oleifera TaxID=397392 RepID=UPI0025AE84CF|nr:PLASMODESMATA CALLOSE-BINDING PROTEIN 3 [Malania oleifera]